MSAGMIKSAICRAIAALPSALWAIASRIVNTIWPGFRDA